jgi:hypothetical protein
MNLPLYCEKEPLVIEAVRRGFWEDELRAHAEDCPVCSDAALAAQFLQEMQYADLAEVKVPSSGWMWWRAQLMAKRAAAERATQPITLVEQMAAACAALSVIGVLIWQWHAIRAWFATVGGTWRLGSYSAQELIVNLWAKSNALLIVSACAFLVVLSLAAYLILAEE